MPPYLASSAQSTATTQLRVSSSCYPICATQLHLSLSLSLNIFAKILMVSTPMNKKSHSFKDHDFRSMFKEPIKSLIPFYLNGFKSVPFFKLHKMFIVDSSHKMVNHTLPSNTMHTKDLMVHQRWFDSQTTMLPNCYWAFLIKKKKRGKVVNLGQLSATIRSGDGRY